jgi:hypothetical protein
MSRVHLEVRQERVFTAIDGSGAARTVPVFRIYAHFRVTGFPKLEEALVDTGAPFSVFPPGTWEKWLGTPTHPGPLVRVPQRDHRSGGLPSEHRVAGCVYAVEYGWLDLTIEDQETRFPTANILACLCGTRLSPPFNPDPIQEARIGLKRTLLGTACGVLDGRYLIAAPHPHPNRRAAWIQDDLPPVRPAVASPTSSRIPPFA